MPDGAELRRDGGRWPLAFAALVAAVGVGWRIVDLTEWPFPFHTTVQYESALAARAIWVAASRSAPVPDGADWFRETRFRHVVSPPVLPALVAGCYLAAGAEIPWVSKVFTTALWLGAGGFVFAAVVRQTGRRWAGAAAFAWFALTPYGLMLSRSFQTEPTAVFGLAVGVWHLSRPGRQLRWRETIGSGLLCGAAAVAKPGVFLPILAAGFAASLLSPAVRGGFLRRAVHAISFAGVAAVPSVGYAWLWLSHRGGELQPDRLVDSAFYAAVAELVVRVVGTPALVLGLVGVGIAAAHRAYTLAGLVAGYLAYVGIFTYHCSTHDYYHAPLLVIVALGLGWVTAACGRWTESSLEPRRASGPVIAASAAVLFGVYVYASRLPFVGPWRGAAVVRTALDQHRADDVRRAETYRAAREAVRPGGRVVALSEEYGYPLEFVTGLRVADWPRRSDAAFQDRIGQTMPADERLSRFVAGGHPVLVVTDFHEFDGQPDLQEAAERRGQVVAAGPGVRVYDLRPVKSTASTRTASAKPSR